MKKIKQSYPNIISFVCIMMAVLITQTSQANVYSWTNGTNLSYQADLTISGDVLTVVLTNNSSVASSEKTDLFTSFYFDISGNPVLTTVGSSGDLWKGSLDNPDTLVEDNRNLIGSAFEWQYKEFAPGSWPVEYGLSSVWNNYLGFYIFPGALDGEGFGIYTGEYSGPGTTLDGRHMVKDSATFWFEISGGLKDIYTNADIGDTVVFGRGSTGEYTYVVPLPATILLGLLGLGVGGLKLRKTMK